MKFVFYFAVTTYFLPAFADNLNKEFAADIKTKGLKPFPMNVYKIRPGFSSIDDFHKVFPSAQLEIYGKGSAKEERACFLPKDSNLSLQFVGNTSLSIGLISSIRLVEKKNKLFKCKKYWPLKHTMAQIALPLRLAIGHTQEQIVGRYRLTKNTDHLKNTFGQKFQIKGTFPLAENNLDYMNWDAKREECFQGLPPFKTFNQTIYFHFRKSKLVEIEFSYTETIC